MIMLFVSLHKRGYTSLSSRKVIRGGGGGGGEVGNKGVARGRKQVNFSWASGSIQQ